MKCQYNYLYEGEHFSEWRKECKECHRFNECLMANDMLTGGDNYPTYAEIHKRLKAHNDRKDMIKKLLQEQEPPITKEDVENLIIDLGLFNLTCKPIIKKHNKRKP